MSKKDWALTVLIGCLVAIAALVAKWGLWALVAGAIASAAAWIVLDYREKHSKSPQVVQAKTYEAAASLVMGAEVTTRVISPWSVSVVPSDRLRPGVQGVRGVLISLHHKDGRVPGDSYVLRVDRESERWESETPVSGGLVQRAFPDDFPDAPIRPDEGTYTARWFRVQDNALILARVQDFGYPLGDLR